MPVARVQFAGGSSAQTPVTKQRTSQLTLIGTFLDVLARANELSPATLEAVTPGQSKRPVGMSHGLQDIRAKRKSRIKPNSYCMKATCFVCDISPWVAKFLQGVNTHRGAHVHTMSLGDICSLPFNQNLLLLRFLFCLVTEARLHMPSRGSKVGQRAALFVAALMWKKPDAKR